MLQELAEKDADNDPSYFDTRNLYLDPGRGGVVDARQYDRASNEIFNNDIVIGQDTKGSMLVGGLGNDILYGNSGDDLILDGIPESNDLNGSSLLNQLRHPLI